MVFSPKKIVVRGPYTSIDVFDQAAIRHIITEFYTVQNQLPCLRTLHQRLNTLNSQEAFKVFERWCINSILYEERNIEIIKKNEEKMRV